MSELKPTAEESIRHFEAQQKRYVREHNGKPCPHYVNAIDALRRAQPANEPLTLEDLRGMDGEPVWLKDGIGEGWFLTSTIVGSKIYFCEKSITVGEPITGCGKTWLAYRRKPGGEQE